MIFPSVDPNKPLKIMDHPAKHRTVSAKNAAKSAGLVTFSARFCIVSPRIRSPTQKRHRNQPKLVSMPQEYFSNEVTP